LPRWLCAVVSANKDSRSSTLNHSGTISGRVVDARTREPVAEAGVAYSIDGNRSKLWSVETDSEGRFLLEGVPAGTIYVAASKPGYLDGSYGQRLVNGAGRGLDLADDEHARGIEVPLWKEASVSGRVLDEKGQPVVRVMVHVLRLEIRGGVRQLVTGKTGLTDAAGRYHVTRITPGTYAVAVLSDSATFYPAARTAADASLIEVESGDEREIDVSVGAPVAFRVSGIVPDVPANAFGPEVRPQVELLPSPTAVPSTNLGGARVRIAPDGRYGFPKVPPGEYVLRVVVLPRRFGRPQTVTPVPQRAETAEPGTLVATASITVDDRDLTDVTLRLRPAARISGQVVFDGEAARPTAQELLGSPVRVTAVDGQSLTVPSAGIEADGRFVTDGLPPGRYAVDLRLDRYDVRGRWTLAWPVQLSTWAGSGLPVGAIELGDTDVTGITITLSDRVAELTGVVRDRDGKVRSDATIYLLPAVQALWIGEAVRQTRSSRDGRYIIASLPTGAYLVVAAVDEPPELWRDVGYLTMLAGSATRVAVARGETKTLDLTIR
jgi:hypothetical protein